MILENGKDDCFRCAALDGWTTLTACEKFCPKHSGCYTVAEANDELVLYETTEKTGSGLNEILEKGHLNYGELVGILYDIANITGKSDEIEAIVRDLDEIDSSQGY